MAREAKNRKRTNRPKSVDDTAINPLPTPMHGDHNMVSPATRAQEASFEPYEGQFEEFREQPETDRSGIRRDVHDVQRQEHRPGRRVPDEH